MMTRDEIEWAVQAFDIIHSEWAKQYDWESARKIKPHSAKVQKLEAFLTSAPAPVAEEIVRRANARRSSRGDMDDPKPLPDYFGEK